MTALANNKGNIQVLTDFYVQDRTNGLDAFEATATINPRVDYLTIRNPTAVTIVVKVDLPLAYLETARTYTSTSVGTVSGNTTSGSGAILDTAVSLAAAASVTYAISSTYDTTPQNLQNDSVPFATTTPIAYLTEVTQDGTTVTDPDPVGWPLRPVYLGTPEVVGPNVAGTPFFKQRTPNVYQILSGLTARLGDAQVQQLCDWIEMGYTLSDIVEASKGSPKLPYTTTFPTLDTNRYQAGSNVSYNSAQWHTSGRMWLPYGQNDPAYSTRFFTDFLNNSQLEGLVATASGTGAAKATTAGTANHPGVVNLSTGTTSTGVTHIGTDTNAILIGTGDVIVEFAISLALLSTVGEEFIVRAGLFDANSGANPVNGCYLEYDRLNSLKWRYCTAAASSRTQTAATTADIAATTWYKLRVHVNTDRTSVAYYVNDVLLGRQTATIPSAAMGAGIHIIKSAGTTARTLDVDYALLAMSFATAR